VVDVVGSSVVVATELDDVGTGSAACDFDDFPAAPAIPAMRRTDTTGTAIFAHSGQARSHPIGVVAFAVCASTFGSCCVASIGTPATAWVGAASSGAYHLPSDASHHPGSSGWRSRGPRG